jgi:hypothetical protein
MTKFLIALLLTLTPFTAMSEDLDSWITSVSKGSCISEGKKFGSYWEIQLGDSAVGCVKFNQATLVRDELYFVQKGQLVAVDIDQFYDLDSPSPSFPELKKRYYISGSCQFKNLLKKPLNRDLDKKICQDLLSRWEKFKTVDGLSKEKAKSELESLEAWPDPNLTTP